MGHRRILTGEQIAQMFDPPTDRRGIIRDRRLHLECQTEIVGKPCRIAAAPANPRHDHPRSLMFPLCPLMLHRGAFRYFGPYCVLSYDAVAQLRARGVQATRLEDGYPEWKAAGLPVET